MKLALAVMPEPIGLAYCVALFKTPILGVIGDFCDLCGMVLDASGSQDATTEGMNDMSVPCVESGGVSGDGSLLIGIVGCTLGRTSGRDRIVDEGDSLTVEEGFSVHLDLSFWR